MKVLTTGRVPHLATLRNRLVLFILGFGCRHPEGIVCDHRHFEYDNWLAGYHAAARLQSKEPTMPTDHSASPDLRTLRDVWEPALEQAITYLDAHGDGDTEARGLADRLDDARATLVRAALQASPAPEGLRADLYDAIESVLASSHDCPCDMEHLRTLWLRDRAALAAPPSEALDTIRLARAIDAADINSEAMSTEEMASDIAREYARLQSKEPTPSEPSSESRSK